MVERSAQMWIVIVEKELWPSLEVKVLVSPSNSKKEGKLAIQTVLDTPLPIDIPVAKRDGQTARELGYRMSCYYKIQDVRIPQVVAWCY